MIHPKIKKHFPGLNKQQKEIVQHTDGALLVIAGPGSGKTRSLVLRALNLLLQEKAAQEEIVLCTFTEKAAAEMKQRFSAYAKKVKYDGDLSAIRISTIHGLCNDILRDYRQHVDIGNGHETMDELSQKLFIHKNFDDIIGEDKTNLTEVRWKTRWTTIEGVVKYFNKITEELVDTDALMNSGNDFLAELGAAYESYALALKENHQVDFGHMQRHVHDLLTKKKRIGTEVSSSIRYLLVDEYQDTNYIQQQLILKLAAKHGNLCVVGDEDQSIYRFRGSTVRNILEFNQHVPNCKTIKLTTNYRSHKDIVKQYDDWMTNTIDWTDRTGNFYRYDKTIEANPKATHGEYPSIFSIRGTNEADEAKRFAELVKFLKKQNVISDYNQVALLLHSVREKHSGAYIDALKNEDICYFCPRARTFFDIPEIRMMVACYACLLGWYGGGRGEVRGAVEKLADYVEGAFTDLCREKDKYADLVQELRECENEISSLEEEQVIKVRLADYFYRFMAFPPFSDAQKRDKNIAHNLALFSQLLATFQNYYGYQNISLKNRESLKLNFFSSFLRLVYNDGINEYEDTDQPFPSGHVQIMTIHQAKGLEFPVVVVGSLGASIMSPKVVDRDLADFYNRVAYEPENKITDFDRMRLHYVAFSRAQQLLVLTTNMENKGHKEHFNPILQRLDQWPQQVDKKSLAKLPPLEQEREQVKKSYSFTTDLRMYETCPRQYQMFREYEFTPSRSGAFFFGLLVHHTIEEIHRIVLDKKSRTLDEKRIQELFAASLQRLEKRDIRQIDDNAKNRALEQVMNYFNQNKKEMLRVKKTEVDVSIEKDDYILTGAVDLIMDNDGKLALLDFKTSKRPDNDPEQIESYERQLCTYAHVVENRYKTDIERLILYWTAEPKKEKAVMNLNYDRKKIDEAGRHFDNTVELIQKGEFDVKNPPDAKVCGECDFQRLCRRQNIIK